MLAQSLRQKVALWFIAALVMTSLIGFASPATSAFAGGECVDTGCSAD